MNTKRLYRPMNIEELSLIEDSGWTKFPPRLFHQPIFYPVTNVEYARQITQEWNIPSYGNGFVVSFNMDIDYLSQFKDFCQNKFELTKRGHLIGGYFLDPNFKIDSSKFETLGDVKIRKELNFINAKDEDGNQRLNIVGLSLGTPEKVNTLNDNSVYELKISN